MWEGLSGLLSGSMSASRSEMVEHLVGLASACRLDVGGFARTLARSVLGRTDGIEEAARRVKRISVKGFIDPGRSTWSGSGSAASTLRRWRRRARDPAYGSRSAPNTIPGLYAPANRGHVAVAELIGG